jgi:hypothetical protein
MPVFKKITAPIIAIFALASIYSTSVQAKDIQSKAIDLASDYFLYATALQLLGGKDTQKSLNSTGRKDWRFLGRGEQGGVRQSAYLSLSPQFLMVTISKSQANNSLLGISVTRIDKDIPFSDIKYLAFKSSSSGSGKSKTTVFYMGDSSSGGVPIRHLMQETGQYTGADYTQVSWLYTIKN